MVIVAFILFVAGMYWFLLRVRHKDMPAHEREVGARIGRSVYGMAPLPGLMGQPPADFLPGPYRESVGPDESHTMMLDGAGRPVMNRDDAELALGPYREPGALVMVRPRMPRSIER